MLTYREWYVFDVSFSFLRHTKLSEIFFARFWRPFGDFIFEAMRCVVFYAHGGFYPCICPNSLLNCAQRIYA